MKLNTNTLVENKKQTKKKTTKKQNKNAPLKFRSFSGMMIAARGICDYVLRKKIKIMVKLLF